MASVVERKLLRSQDSEYASRARNLAHQRRGCIHGTALGALTLKKLNGLPKQPRLANRSAPARLHRYVVATIIFYQKPGCATNARQIQALKSAGPDVIAQDIFEGAMGRGGIT